MGSNLKRKMLPELWIASARDLEDVIIPQHQ